MSYIPSQEELEHEGWNTPAAAHWKGELDEAHAALAAANEHADRLAEALRAVPHWRLVSFITGLPDDPPQCEGGCPGCAADKALAEHEARKGSASRARVSPVVDGADRHEPVPDPLAAIPKIIASLRLSPDPATRADAERLAEAYQREHATIDKLAEALRVLADKRTTNESARVEARALLAHLGLEGGERG